MFCIFTKENEFNDSLIIFFTWSTNLNSLNLLVGSVDCWFGLFMGFCHIKKNVEYL